MQLWSTITETKGDNYAIMTYNYRCQGRQLRNYEKPKVQLCDSSRTLLPSLSLSASLTLLPLSLSSSLSLPSTERAKLAGALRFTRGHYHSLLGAHGFSTERARLAGGTSLRSWFQKKCLLPMGILIFFSKIPPILKLEGGFFST